MKNKFLLYPIIFIVFASCSHPDSKEIFKKAFEKCQLVQNGYYEMTRFVKYSTDKDTSVSSFKCYFKKIRGDSFSSTAFHYREFFRNEGLDDNIHIRENLYTGEDFVLLSEDSNAEVISRSKWPMRVETCMYGSILFTPFTDEKSFPLLNDSDIVRNKSNLTLMEDEEINGTACYHLKLNKESLIDSSAFIKVLSGEYHFWIRKDDFMPMQYTSFIKNMIERDTVYQFEKYILNNYEINSLKDEKMLTLKSIPSNYRVTYFKGIGVYNSLP